jgi:hypothetical protein
VNEKDAKKALDKIVYKSRIHAYKPIQIAEILRRSRTEKDIDIRNLESYRNSSKHWRDSVSLRLVGNVSTSSQKFQDDLFNPHAMPPEKLSVLDETNKSRPGLVENYIYHVLKERWRMVALVGAYIEKASPSTFSLSELISFFVSQSGLKKSVDKAYEVVVHALFSSIVAALKAEITLELKNPNPEILKDFEELTSVVLGVNAERTSLVTPARLYRMGVTYAADTGVDIGTNFGPIVQVKYISLDEEQAGEIIESAPAEKIVIVCKDADRSAIAALVKQLGLGEKIRGIIAQSDLERWYDLALKKHEKLIGKNLLSDLLREFREEFPLVEEMDKFLEERGYKPRQLKGEWSVDKRVQRRFGEF